MPSQSPFPLHEDPTRQAIRNHYHADEAQCVDQLLSELHWPQDLAAKVHARAVDIAGQVREQNESHGGLDAFLHEFKLSSQEGIALMCLAEALLRVPDADTADELIQDKLLDADWSAHIGESDSFFVNASTWGLMLTGKVIAMDRDIVHDATDFFSRLVSRTGEPVIRAAVRQAMKIMGRQFVLAETIEKGVKTAAVKEAEGYLYSYDMLGEAARTDTDARSYLDAYLHAISVIGGVADSSGAETNPGISVKLSALHPRYEYLQGRRIMDELYPRLKATCLAAADAGIGLTIDAEESERLEPSLELLEALCADSDLEAWQGLGFVVQAYQKRAPHVIDWIADLGRKNGRKLMIRLVKGAYWDTEIKRAQVDGHAGYPVFTRKISTDLSYLVCAQKLLNAGDVLYPLFATHNAHTVAAVLEIAGENRSFEFQCLHGMGEILYDHVIASHGVRCRIYAPVGPHRDLLAYLVRRLLENGANSSFVNRLVDRELPISRVVADPVAMVRELEHKPHPRIPVPADLFPDRRNSAGMNLNDPDSISEFCRESKPWREHHWAASALYADGIEVYEGNLLSRQSPSTGQSIGSIRESMEDEIEHAATAARNAQDAWDNLGGQQRAEILNRAADLYEANGTELISLCLSEAGKTLNDGIAELREAVDFLRYYAAQCAREFSNPRDLPGPTGESNQWSLHGRGVFVCISPWNFPLAIFTGQISAALAAGNTVLAKPAEQTPIIAWRATRLLHAAGVPAEVLQLLPGPGETIGAGLVAHPDISGVTFTGSTEVARIISNVLANKQGEIVPLIAETGGLNAMLVDSTALPEQVVRDVIQSAFQSAGQRCSALRIMVLQAEIADSVIEMLSGALAELKVGDPWELDTDIGPIIDDQARAGLQAHINRMARAGAKIHYGPDIQGVSTGTFLSPVIIEVQSVSDLEQEVFGPVLHVCRYQSDSLEQVIDEINATGYGLTFGIHSRIQSRIEQVATRIKAGNIYVNRNMIGAVVGVQPFGGRGLSGTGPKAGGPLYLHQFAHERSLSNDITASGGNTDLMSLDYL